ncbi:hypothetical protein Q3G72_007259 [Acer saccharum]|nr:hypothetical protein Q3G72_007259 [Acer saccharum]
MDSLAIQMANFNEGMVSFASRASTVTEDHSREDKEIGLKEGDLGDEMKRNLQQTQTTYERLLNGFMEASQDRFSRLEKMVKKIEGHIGRIADKVLNGEIGSSSDSLHLGSAKAILRCGRIVNNGRNEELIEESNKTPRERNDEEKEIPAREDIGGERIQVPNEEETPKVDPSNNKLPSPIAPRVPVEEEASEREFCQDRMDELIHANGDIANDLGDPMEGLIGTKMNNKCTLVK